MSEELTQARLKELLHYDPDTGVFTWRVAKSVPIGRVAGTPDGKGYLMVGIDGTRYKLHRLVFLYLTGEHPADQVDHINGVVTDNRATNLRLCTAKENGQNRKLNRNSTTGFTGVSQHPCGYRARIGVNNSRLDLGLYSTREAAYAAYLAAKAKMHSLQPVPREAACAT